MVQAVDDALLEDVFQYDQVALLVDSDDPFYAGMQVRGVARYVRHHANVYCGLKGSWKGTAPTSMSLHHAYCANTNT
eukprot:scaffold349080_cov33-Prasinocladus_malaysianus.AAC.2